MLPVVEQARVRNGLVSHVEGPWTSKCPQMLTLIRIKIGQKMGKCLTRSSEHVPDKDWPDLSEMPEVKIWKSKASPDKSAWARIIKR
jgi:hypothetical protein